nr:acyl-CoA-binding domain-containing protein 4 isoform X3 [Dromaius novaehollandiae]
MEEAGCGAQFRAAVQVIQGLPRSGSYRPSYEEMLRFYSYYKQATAGRCQGPRPGFWDPIGRYKWDAWHSLGRMSKEEAMAAYVAEMKKVAQKVIDTVPMDEATQEMFRYFEPLYEVIQDMPRPPDAFFKRKGDNQEQMPDPGQDSPEGSPARDCLQSALPEEEKHGEQVPGGRLNPAAEALEGTQVTSDSEGEVYCDTLEQMEPDQPCPALPRCALYGQISPSPYCCKLSAALCTPVFTTLVLPHRCSGRSKGRQPEAVRGLARAGPAAAPTGPGWRPCLHRCRLLPACSAWAVANNCLRYHQQSSAFWVLR